MARREQLLPLTIWTSGADILWQSEQVGERIGNEERLPKEGEDCRLVKRFAKTRVITRGGFHWPKSERAVGRPLSRRALLALSFRRGFGRTCSAEYGNRAIYVHSHTHTRGNDETWRGCSGEGHEDERSASNARATRFFSRVPATVGIASFWGGGCALARHTTQDRERTNGSLTMDFLWYGA